MVFSSFTGEGVPFEEFFDELFLRKRNGFFVELGANDGLHQSNTAFLEFQRDWTGVLLEPSLPAFEACVKNRPGAKVYRCACVSKEYPSSEVLGDFQATSLTASIGGTRNRANQLCSVPARTLSSVLEEAQCPARFDLLSLDVEGYEVDVLLGLDLNRFRPHYMLIELYQKEYQAVVTLLKENGYELQSNLSNYNKLNNPRWDGTHNDYLFYDTTR